MLGRRIIDPSGVEGGDRAGLGMIELSTEMAGRKVTTATTVEFATPPEGALDSLRSAAKPHVAGSNGATPAMDAVPAAGASAWACLGGLRVEGYEIRHGVVSGSATQIGAGAWVEGNVMATTVHGLFEDPVLLGVLLGRTPPAVLERTFDLLADAVDEYLDTDYLRALVGC